VNLLELSPPVLQSQCFPGLGEKITKLKAGEGGYFPEEPPCQDLRLLRGFWTYSDKLKQLKEPTLLTPGHTAYRFLWLRSFHQEIAVRVWVDGEKKMLSIKELNPRTRDERTRLMVDQSRTLMVDQTRTLRSEEWATFVKLLDESCFWKMSTTVYGPIASTQIDPRQIA
jgi:hypothetical protein